MSKPNHFIEVAGGLAYQQAVEFCTEHEVRYDAIRVEVYGVDIGEANEDGYLRLVDLAEFNGVGWISKVTYSGSLAVFASSSLLLPWDEIPRGHLAFPRDEDMYSLPIAAAKQLPKGVILHHQPQFGSDSIADLAEVWYRDSIVCHPLERPFEQIHNYPYSSQVHLCLATNPRNQLVSLPPGISYGPRRNTGLPSEKLVLCRKKKAGTARMRLVYASFSQSGDFYEVENVEF